MNNVVMFSGCARCASNLESRTVSTRSRMSSSGGEGWEEGGAGEEESGVGGVEEGMCGVKGGIKLREGWSGGKCEVK